MKEEKKAITKEELNRLKRLIEIIDPSKKVFKETDQIINERQKIKDSKK